MIIIGVDPGSTATGYLDAFGSFGWFGFLKFWIAGYIMGVLYRHAMQGAFLGQLLYIHTLPTAMLMVTHQTNEFLVRIWIYFLVLAYPVFYLAKYKPVPYGDPAPAPGGQAFGPDEEM